MVIKRIMRLYAVYITVLFTLHLIRFVPTDLLHVLNVVSYAGGIILILFVLIKDKPFMPKGQLFPLFCILGTFFICYAVSISISRDPASNLTVFASTGIQMFLILYYLAGSADDESENVLRLMMNVLASAGTLIAIANITLFLIGSDFMKTGRFRGIFYNPKDAFVCGISLACCLWLMRFGNWKKWLLAICIAFLAAAVFLSGSRASLIMIAVVICLFAFFRITEKKGWNWLKAVAISLAAVAVCVVLYLAASQFIEYQWQSGLANKTGATMEEIQQATQGGQYQASLSASLRMYLVQCGLNTFAEYPVFGVTSRGIAQAAIRVNGIEGQMVQLSGIESGFHNSYLQALVSNGLAGFIPLLCLLAYCIVTFVKGWSTEVKYAAAILIGLSIYGIFEGDLIFMNSPSSLFFWALIGYAINRAICAQDRIVRSCQLDTSADI